MPLPLCPSLAAKKSALPPSSFLPPSFLSPLGQELLPSQIQSLHLLFSELGMKRRGSELAQPSNPLTARFLLSLLKWALVKPVEESSESPSGSLKLHLLLPTHSRLGARAPNSTDVRSLTPSACVQAEATRLGSQARPGPAGHLSRPPSTPLSLSGPGPRRRKTISLPRLRDKCLEFLERDTCITSPGFSSWTLTCLGTHRSLHPSRLPGIGWTLSATTASCCAPSSLKEVSVWELPLPLT